MPEDSALKKFFGQESGIRPGAVYLIEVDDINNRVVLGNWGGCPEYIENEKVLRHFRKDHETNVMKRLADQHLFGSDVTTSIYKNKNGNFGFSFRKISANSKPFPSGSRKSKMTRSKLNWKKDSRADL